MNANDIRWVIRWTSKPTRDGNLTFFYGKVKSMPEGAPIVTAVSLPAQATFFPSAESAWAAIEFIPAMHPTRGRVGWAERYSPHVVKVSVDNTPTVTMAYQPITVVTEEE